MVTISSASYGEHYYGIQQKQHELKSFRRAMADPPGKYHFSLRVDNCANQPLLVNKSENRFQSLIQLAVRETAFFFFPLCVCRGGLRVCACARVCMFVYLIV